MKREIKSSLIAGLIVVVPLASVLIMIQWLVSLVSNYFGLQMFAITAYPLINQVLGLTAVIVLGIVSVTVLGFLVKTYLGRRAEEKIDKLLERIPLIGTVYDLTKTTSRELLDGSQKFKKPVRVETGNIRRTAFETGKTTEDGRKVLFMPTSPNITSGFVIEVDPDDIVETDEDTEQALERLLSAGFGGK